MQKYHFKSAVAHLKTFHGIHLNSDMFEEYAFHAWDKIGNKRYGLYTFKGTTDRCRLQIPCNAESIEAVTSDIVDYQGTDNVLSWNNGNFESENWIEGEKSKSSAFYTKGRLITYQTNGDSLIFERDYDNVFILYKGLLLDDEGYPLLNSKEVEAIANYCAYVETRKNGMINKDKATIEISQLLKAEWEKSAAHARTPEYLNQNDWNELLEAKNSWDRKRYNTSFKPVSK